MTTFTLTTAAGAAVAAAAFALAAPALASADTSATPPGGRTATNNARASIAGGAPTTPEGVAQDIASFRALKEAIRNGTADSTAPIPGVGGSPIDSVPDIDNIPDVGSLPDFNPADVTSLPHSP